MAADAPSRGLERASDCIHESVGSAAVGIHRNCQRCHGLSNTRAVVTTALDVDAGLRITAGHFATAIITSVLAATGPETTCTELRTAETLRNEVAARVSLSP